MPLEVSPHPPRGPGGAPSAPRTIVIAGAGFSGVVTAVHLLRGALQPPARIVLIERPGRGTGGVAYDVDSPRLVLNVPAARMSAFPDAPDDFVAFLRSRDARAGPADFASRRAYGEYLAARLDAAVRAATGRVALDLVAGEVRDLAHDPLGRLRIEVDCAGPSLELVADAVLLATGNVEPEAPRWVAPWMRAEGRYVEAWAPGAAAPGAADETVVLVGTGLTMADLVVELRARGHAGPIVALSRRGLLPRLETGSAPAPEPGDLAELPTRSLRMRPLLRALRVRAREFAQESRDWRTLVAGVRLRAPELWQALPEPERARFLRHVRTWWDVHRHRLPLALHRELDAERAAGTLEIVAGRIVAAERGPVGLRLRLECRGGGPRTLDAVRVVNCTGARAGAPLGPPWPALLERGLACRDAQGLGILTDDHGRVLDAAGRAQPDLCYAGPLWRAQWWEMTAVPELRTRLPRVAAALAAAAQPGAGEAGGGQDGRAATGAAPAGR